MDNEFKKIKRQIVIYSITILLLVILNYSFLISNYSFKLLPLSITIVNVISVIILYLLYKTSLSLIHFAKSYGVQESDIKEKEKTNEQKSVDREDIEKRYKDLLAGITKKTSKKGITEKFLKNVINDQQADIGLFYTFNKKSKTFELGATYAYLSEDKPENFKSGEGINGQVVKNKKAMLIEDVPENYLTIVSGLGRGKPKNLFIYPIIINDKVQGVLELASFRDFSSNLDEELTKFFEINSDKFLNIEDN